MEIAGIPTEQCNANGFTWVPVSDGTEVMWLNANFNRLVHGQEYTVVTTLLEDCKAYGVRTKRFSAPLVFDETHTIYIYEHPRLGYWDGRNL